jgi:hypothetical protein
MIFQLFKYMLEIPEFGQTVKSSSEHLLAERDEIGRFGQVKVLMAPVLASSSTTCLYLIND